DRDIGDRTLVLEQMLTTGGGWQDQYGGILHGIKQLETKPGLDQIPDVRWLPKTLFNDPVYMPSLLLYYTGITRVAKDLLGEIVRGMFLNKKEHLDILNRLFLHAGEVNDLIQRGQFEGVGRAIRRTWELNQQLDAGTNPEEVQNILKPIDDWLLGMKLLGAGGGGYILMVAKDSNAAVSIRKHLEKNPPNSKARFVQFIVSDTGLQVTRS
ncbi:MAG: bifunctional fucokinase/L-fucose-1-P-guanylyltransferase, partial [Verrucomicrobia bacterium]|nr:bifunctional fucokinase/L-fucose-1-P-guanylyltransferase [Verrucomicrobiota bacterium]